MTLSEREEEGLRRLVEADPEMAELLEEATRAVPAAPEVTKTVYQMTKEEYIAHMLDENAFVRKGDKWLKPDASGKLQEATARAESLSKEFADTYDKIIAPKAAIPKAVPAKPEVAIPIKLTKPAVPPT